MRGREYIKVVKSRKSLEILGKKMLLEMAKWNKKEEKFQKWSMVGIKNSVGMEQGTSTRVDFEIEL